jgi:hypothetical protein
MNPTQKKLRALMALAKNGSGCYPANLVKSVMCFNKFINKFNDIHIPMLSLTPDNEVCAVWKNPEQKISIYFRHPIRVVVRTTPGSIVVFEIGSIAALVDYAKSWKILPGSLTTIDHISNPKRGRHEKIRKSEGG